MDGAQPPPPRRRPRDGRGDYILCRQVRANNLPGVTLRTRPSGGGKAEGTSADEAERRSWGGIDAAERSVQIAGGQSGSQVPQRIITKQLNTHDSYLSSNDIRSLNAIILLWKQCLGFQHGYHGYNV